MARDTYARKSLGTLHGKIKQSRVLLVGAGGIGCELLKNIVLAGFGEIHIVDLDTIDLSNLNRQFLFRHEHIKKSKAIVAKESATSFNPTVKIEAHHANIKDTHFDAQWFGSFALVFNALDNIDARRHVNKMCIAAGVPLVESGTTGFNGQVQVIRQGTSECYECNPKETPKTFAICTIRSTPSQPIHCIVWAKSYLFNELFGVSEDADMDQTEDAGNAAEIRKLKEEAAALSKIRESIGSEDFPRLVFDKVFTEDVKRLRSMEDMWKTRSPPEPLDFEHLSQAAEAEGIGMNVMQRDQSAWTPSENFVVFRDSLMRLSRRWQDLKGTEHSGTDLSVLTFDKDDPDTLDFVTACSNLRSRVFGIEVKSKFDVKQMAGNIIPAIATTNAMIAGLCVLQAFKVLREDLSKARNVFLTTSTDRVISSEPLRSPRPDCPVCSAAQSRLKVDFSRATLGDLVNGVLKGELNYGDELSVSNETGILFDPELDENIKKKLCDLGVAPGSFITVVDDEDDPRVDLHLFLAEETLPPESHPVRLSEQPVLGKKPQPVLDGPVSNGDGAASKSHSAKRKRSPDELEQESRKRGKAPALRSAEDDVILVTDATGGAIVIDD